RQGLTIAEHGELGGPGMGGCPVGPSQQNAPSGSFSAVPSPDKTSVQVNWTPATPVPGATAVTGYSVVALGAPEAGVQSQVGVRTGSLATRATLSGLDAAKVYSYEVRSIAGGAMSAAFAPTAAAPTNPDTTTPRLSLAPAPDANPATVVETPSVTATSESGADLYYAVGESAIEGDLPSDAAVLYTGPIPVTGQVTLHFAAFDRAGNSETAVGTYAPVSNVPALAAPTGLAAAPGQGSVKLTWAGVTGATGYEVSTTPAGGTATKTPVAAQTTTLTGLTAGTTYSFTVAAVNSAGVVGAPSTPVTASPIAVTDRVSITLGKWRAGDFRVGGSVAPYAPGTSVTVHRNKVVGGVNTIGDPITGAVAAVTAPVAPATAGDYSIRVRNGAPTTNPGLIWVKSSAGGVAGPFTVTNG
ncbi:MAG TPA: fibronectin type III domain-containing protein, partial [Actinoplanes sp.]